MMRILTRLAIGPVALLLLVGLVAAPSGAATTARAEVHGAVRLANGTAITPALAASLTVRLRPVRSGQPDLLVTPDARGRYALENVAAGTYRAVVLTDGRYWSQRKLVEIRGGSPRRIDFTLRRATTIRGTVTLRGVEGPVQVTLLRKFGTVWRQADSVTTTTGAFALRARAAKKSDYRVVVGGEHGKRTEEWWNGGTYGTSDERRAKTFTVRAGGTVGGRNLTIVPQRAVRAALTGTPGRRRATLRLSVAGAEEAAHPTGRATFYAGSRRVATVRVVDGRASVTVTSLKPGVRHFRVRFHGSPSWMSTYSHLRLTIR